jgi:hypothetical protein
MTTVQPPATRYATPAPDEQIERTVQALAGKGMKTFVANDGQEVLKLLADLIPAGAEVFTANSASLNQLGVTAEIDRPDGPYDSVRVKLSGMDPKTQNRAMQKLGATPEYVVGSIHALTEGGTAVIASATGSQLASYASGAAKVIWILGTQKLVANLEEAFKRIEEYTLPLEDQRLMQARNAHSSINKLLVVHKDFAPGRTTIILVKQVVGF